MKSLGTIMAATLLGLCLLFDLGTPTAYADFAFGKPVNLKSVIPVIDPVHDGIVNFSSDGLEIYIESDRAGGYGQFDAWVVRRESTGADWRPPENLGPVVNSSSNDSGPCISADGLEIYFRSDRPGGYGSHDVYVTTRASKNAPWEEPMNLGPKVNSPNADSFPWISSNGLELYLASGRPGGSGRNDLYVIRRASANDPWGDAENLGPVVNSTYQEWVPCLSPDGLLLFFQDLSGTVHARPGGLGGSDIWMTRRADLSEPWGTPMNLGPAINGPNLEAVPRVSPDGSTFYFTTYAAGLFDIWQAAILPTIDFNTDGKVDLVDLVMLIDNWGTDRTLYDIG
ncbi:MAG: hypothetical protein EHM35_16675, partial [Planctomycetaceae bacterium]